jgi:hypothetical protein
MMRIGFEQRQKFRSFARSELVVKFATAITGSTSPRKITFASYMSPTEQPMKTRPSDDVAIDVGEKTTCSGGMAS